MPPRCKTCSAGLTNLEHAPVAEIVGRVPWRSEVFNCSAPDTGDMESIERDGSPELKERWLKPLLAGEMRQAFLMTAPAVASSDATNIEDRKNMLASTSQTLPATTRRCRSNSSERSS